MAKIKIAIQIPLEVIVNGTKEDYIKEVVKSAEDKYNKTKGKYKNIDIE